MTKTAEKLKPTTEIEEPESVPAIVEPKETGLALIDPAKVPAYFAKDGGNPLIQMLEIEVDKFLPTQDISTEKGRKAIRSFLYKLKRSKNAIDDERKKFVSVPKAIAKVGDQEGARIWDAIEAMEKKAGAALAEWETSEAKRIDDHKKAIAVIESYRTPFAHAGTVAYLTECLDSLGRYANRDWQEFALKGKQALDGTRTYLESRIAAIEKEEADREAKEQEELAAQLRAKKIREQAIAEKAKADADAAAKRIADELAAKVQADKEQAARELIKAENLARQAELDRQALAEKMRLDAIKTEQDRVAAEAKAAQDLIDAENRRLAAIEKARVDAADALEAARAKQAADKLKADQEQAKAVQKALDDAEAEREIERTRIEAEQAKEAKIEADRIADREHQDKILTQAQTDLFNLLRLIPPDVIGDADSLSEFVIDAIRDGKISHVTIAY